MAELRRGEIRDAGSARGCERIGEHATHRPPDPPGRVVDPLSYAMMEQEVRRLSKLLGLMLAESGRTDERVAFAVTHARMREPLNAELCVKDQDGVTSAWLEPRRDPDLIYTPPEVKL